MATGQASNQARETERETLHSVLCSKEDWTPNEVTTYKSLAFREDGIGCLKLLNDQPGTLLVCEFDWEISTFNPRSAKPETIVDTQQKDLEASLRTRQLARFDIMIKLRNSKPREEFGDFGTLNVKESLSRRLKEVAFEEEEYFTVVLEVGNFAPDHDTNSPDSEAFGRTRWGLRLSFRDHSPIPALDKWHEDYQTMVESQYWESETNWFSRKLRGSSTDTWAFDTVH